MKLKIKAIIALCLLLAASMLVTGCGQEPPPYDTNDAENFNVSVKFDANGGQFTTNTTILVDSYDISNLKTNSEGKVEIALIAPDNQVRGTGNYFVADRGSAYFLAGWYSQRIESTDSEGNTVYSYSGRWDFDKDRLVVDPSQEHSSWEPAMTLYAAWVPMFNIEFYSLNTGELLQTKSYNPINLTELKVPAWNTETGTVNMYDFPENSGHTFNGVYLDAEGKQSVQGDVIRLADTLDYETGTASADSTTKLYVDWMEGEWYHIYNVQQFQKNASISGNYILHADLDFTGEYWPTSLMHGNFTGTIVGNGHTIKNVTLAQTNNSKTNSGIFGHLTETAKISDLTFENVTFTIQAGTRVAGASYGLLAGTISSGAQFTNVQIKNSTLQIDSGCYFGVDDYSIGLLCGMGSANIDYSGITCKAAGDNPASVVIVVNGNTVEVTFVTQ